MMRTAALILVAALCVTACANRLVEDGKRLISEGKTEDGLAMLEQAWRESPRDPEIRTRLINERDLAIMRLLEGAERARAQGNPDAAEDAYRRVLKIDPNHARAKAGLAALQSDVRLKQQLGEAEQLLKKGESAAADAKVRAVLGENPNLAEARALQRRITDQIRAATATAATAAPKPAFTKPITLEFRDTPIRSVFEMISRSSGMNFVFDKDVSPAIRVTIFVRNSNLEDAVKLLLVTNQLERKVLNENSVLIYPNTPAKIKEYQELVVRNFYLGNADVKQTQAMIKSLVHTRDMFIDEKLNLLIVRDTPDAVRMVESLIASQDLAEPEVMLELEVLEVKRSRLQQLGIQYPNQFTVLNIVPNPATTVATATGTVTTAPATTTTSQLTLDLLRGGPAQSQISVSPSPSLNMKRETSDVNLLANPRIRVKNREKAKVHIGDRVPVITTTSTANVGVSQAVNYLDIGLKLDVEPNVLLDDEVSMKVGLEVSNIVREITNTSGVLTYQIGTRTAATVLRLKNGETQVLAGLINDEDRRSSSGIPGLADIPLIGRLFSNRGSDASKTEIMLLITPRVIRNVARPEFYAAAYAGGTDAAPGVAPLRIRPTAAGALSMSGQGGVAARGNSAAPDQPVTLEAVRAIERAAIGITGGAQVAPGGEVVLAIALPAGASSAQLDVVYDPALLNSLSREGPEGAAADAGRATLRIDKAQGGAPASLQARFRAVAKSQAAAQVAIENVKVTNETGQDVPVDLPPPHKINIAP
jgi:general secretion pathway protein D